MHTIRESHLKRAPWGIICPDGSPLVVNGSLARFATMREAVTEACRRNAALQEGHNIARLDSMAGVRVYGMEHVLASSGAN